MIKPIVQTSAARKSYGDFTLGPLDITIEPGFVIAIVGPNGSGKTTLFRMLMNLSIPDSGEIELLGQHHPENEVEIKRRIGYMPEAPVGYEDMTPASLGEFVSHWYPEWNQREYDRMLNEWDVPLHRPFRSLSNGMQRRLSFALALATNAELMLLDEPSSGLDPFARRAMIEEISRYMQDDRRTVLMATHLMEEVRRLCDYILLLHNGRFLGLHEKDALLEQWRSLWIDRQPGKSIPGVVEIQAGTPVRLVTNSPVETEQALGWEGIQVVRSAPLDLEEILDYMMREGEVESPDREPSLAG